MRAKGLVNKVSCIERQLRKIQKSVFQLASNLINFHHRIKLTEKKRSERQSTLKWPESRLKFFNQLNKRVCHGCGFIFKI